MQYIGRLMREIDPEPVQALLAAMRDEGSRDSARFRRIEAWRDRMAAGDGSALDEVAEAFGLADERQLRQLAQLAKSAGEEAAGGKPPHASRKLFRALRALDEAARRAGEDPAGQP
jgi:ribosome-associated protein